MNPFLLSAILMVLVAAVSGFMIPRLAKTIKKGRRYDGHLHAKVTRFCPRQNLPPNLVEKAKPLTGPASPGSEFPILEFEPEPRVQVQTTLPYGMPQGYFQGMQEADIQYDLADPTKVYLCDDRLVTARLTLFKTLCIGGLALAVLLFVLH